MSALGLAWKAVAGGGPAVWVALGLGLVLTLGGTFGAGYYFGNDHVVTKVIDASLKQIADAKDVGKKAQADQDKKDADAARIDYETRQKADAARIAALAGDLAHWKSLVSHDPKCVVPAAAMQGFNDPKVIGEDAQ